MSSTDPFFLILFTNRSVIVWQNVNKALACGIIMMACSCETEKLGILLRRPSPLGYLTGL